MKNGILVAALACTSLMVTSCYTPYPTYGGVAVGVGPGGVGVSASAEWTNASYDADGYPIYGYSYGRPVYGYTAAGVAIFTLAALTTAYYLPYWGCAHWCHHHDVYVHYCPHHCHKCWAPPRCPRGHQPHVRPPHDGPQPGRGVHVSKPSHRGVPDSGRPPMNNRDMGRNGNMPHNGGMNGRDMGRNGHNANMPRNGGMNNRDMGRSGNHGVQNLPRNMQTYTPQRAQNNMPQQREMRGMQNNNLQRMQGNAPQRMQNNSRAMGTPSVQQPAMRTQRNNAMPRQHVQGRGMQGVNIPNGGIRNFGSGTSNRSALGMGGRPSMPSAASGMHRSSTPSFGGGAARSMPSRGSVGSMGGGPRGGMGGGHFGGGRGGRR